MANAQGAGVLSCWFCMCFRGISLGSNKSVSPSKLGIARYMFSMDLCASSFRSNHDWTGSRRSILHCPSSLMKVSFVNAIRSAESSLVDNSRQATSPLRSTPTISYPGPLQRRCSMKVSQPLMAVSSRIPCSLRKSIVVFDVYWRKQARSSDRGWVLSGSVSSVLACERQPLE